MPATRSEPVAHPRVVLRAPVPGPRDYVTMDGAIYVRGRHVAPDGSVEDRPGDDTLSVMEHHVPQLLARGFRRIKDEKPAAPAPDDAKEDKPAAKAK